MALSNDSDLDSELDNLSISCKCPCGRTDFKHCMQPPTDCLDKGFAELDLSVGEDSKKAQTYMEHELAAELNIIKNQEFVRFGMAVYNFAESINKKESVLKRILKLHGQKTDMMDFEAMYDKATEDVDFINFESLNVILEACCSACAGSTKSVLQLAAEVASEKYQETFSKFAQHRVFALSTRLEKITSNSSKGHQELKIKIEEEFQKFPIERIFHFKKILRAILKLQDHVLLRVTSVREGCVEITFQVIGSTCNSNLSLDQKRALASHKISLLEYAGEVAYCCCKLFEDQV